jgi:peptide-methionine (S)-S-oxide reductase
VSLKTITLAGGCFWCLEAVYDRVLGVQDVVSGYSNGDDPAPNYESVCTGRTGHAEVVRIRFDDELVSLTELLEIFFVIHDPTTLNRQGNDVGTQYRSGIYYERDEDLKVIETFVQDAAKQMGLSLEAITTKIEPLRNFHEAEDYHQNFFINHPTQGYCAHVVAPKVAKFQKTFANKLKA